MTEKMGGGVLVFKAGPKELEAIRNTLEAEEKVKPIWQSRNG